MSSKFQLWVFFLFRFLSRIPVKSNQIHFLEGQNFFSCNFSQHEKRRSITVIRLHLLLLLHYIRSLSKAKHDSNIFALDITVFVTVKWYMSLFRISVNVSDRLIASRVFIFVNKDCIHTFIFWMHFGRSTQRDEERFRSKMLRQKYCNFFGDYFAQNSFGRKGNEAKSNLCFLVWCCFGCRWIPMFSFVCQENDHEYSP